jgi:hypothetical protein
MEESVQYGSHPRDVNILIVDDKPANLDALEAILHGTGYTTTRASSGSDALMLLLRSEYACCLLDVRMPDMDGFETARYIRSDVKFGHLPIIFVTAEAGNQRDVYLGYDAGAVDFLIKPLEPVIVRSKVKVFGQLYLQKLELERTKGIEALNVKLKKLNKSLKEANQDLEHFTHIAAHDLREPLRKQRNIIDLVKDKVQPSDPDQAYSLLEYIGECSDQLLGMIDDFRTLTKIGYGELNREPVDLKQLIEQCLAGHEDLIRRFKPRIEFDLQESSACVYTSLVKILYDNLIKNVFDHVEKKRFEIRFTSEEKDGAWVFGVLNTGSQIPQERLQDIFKMFRKWDTRRSDGSGIGLSICKRIIDRHHGKIFAESGNDFSHIKFTFGEMQ